MKFSVIVPTYNRRFILQKCLEALRDQIYPAEDYEVFIVDDGSTDGTQESLRTLPSKFHTRLQARRGPAVARNLGAAESGGDFLAFTDSDCLVPTDWLARLDEAFEKWPEAGAVGGYLQAPEEVLEKNVLARMEFMETHFVYGAGQEAFLGGFESPAGGTNNIAYRRQIFEKLGGFDESFPVAAGEDADLKLRTTRAGYKIGYVPIKVTHLDPYSFGSFLRRSVTSGIGSAYFEKKHDSARLTPWTLAGSFLRDLLKFLLVFLRPLKISAKDGAISGGRNQKLSRSLSFLIILRSLLINYGKIKFYLSRRPADLLLK